MSVSNRTTTTTTRVYYLLIGTLVVGTFNIENLIVKPLSEYMTHMSNIILVNTFQHNAKRMT